MTLSPVYSKLTQLDNSVLCGVPEALFGHSLSPDEMRHASSNALLSNSAALRARMPQIFASLLPQALLQIRQLPEQQHARQVYAMPSAPIGEGHAVAVISMAPMSPPQRELMNSYNLMRFVATSFPGGGAAYTDRQRSAALGSRRVSVPRNIPRPLPRSVIQHNAQLFRDNAPVDGMHLLGGNSWCIAKAHFIAQTPQLRWQTVSWVTTGIHSQDGIVLWNVIQHPEYPEGLIWLSFHYGDHQVPVGDAINAWLAPLLFHPVFQRGMDTAAIYPHIYEELGERAGQLMLNEEFAERVRAHERDVCPKRARQLSALQLFDRTGGLLVTGARYLLGAQVPTAS